MDTITAKKRGRRPIEEPIHNLSIRIKESDFQFLSGIASEQGKTISGYIRDMVEEGMRKKSTYDKQVITVKTKNTTYSINSEDGLEVIKKLSQSLLGGSHATT